MTKQKIIAVVGPTASGKSALGRYLATKLGGEVISADSRQLYQGMRIISRAERGYMVGIANPQKQFSAGAYAQKAAKVIALLQQKNKIPVVVGGTGFYADALLGRMPLPQVEPNPALRRALNKKSNKQLLAQLRRLDQAAAKRVDPANKVRLVRAIEVAKGRRSGDARLEGKAWPSGLERPPEGIAAEPTVLWLGLREPKNLRAGVEARLRAGMVAEARALRKTLSKRRYGELGFEFALLADYLDHKISKAELIDQIANGERKYAKRQSRWFKRNPDIHWVKNKTEALKLSRAFLRAMEESNLH